MLVDRLLQTSLISIYMKTEYKKGRHDGTTRKVSEVCHILQATDFRAEFNMRRPPWLSYLLAPHFRTKRLLNSGEMLGASHVASLP